MEQWNKSEDEEAARVAAKTLAELKRQAAAESFNTPHPLRLDKSRKNALLAIDTGEIGN